MLLATPVPAAQTPMHRVYWVLDGAGISCRPTPFIRACPMRVLTAGEVIPGPQVQYCQELAGKVMDKNAQPFTDMAFPGIVSLQCLRGRAA